MDLVDRPGTVDDDPGVGLVLGLLREAPGDPLVELDTCSLDPIPRRADPLRGDLVGHDEQHHQVGPQPAGGPARHGPDDVHVQPPAVALVRDRGADVAVADHVAPGGQRRFDHLGEEFTHAGVASGSTPGVSPFSMPLSMRSTHHVHLVATDIRFGS